ncbi:PREDICTED: wall-associated receptor kinase 2-like [Ipomoea nil]|uniref:wall-associated receptor kinase 2-like n=1 Tax=Ipomoea nil TaxID=35883 RepID=UPI0009014067|nr:PREDICTED: wall-associated receptor kinase 2-like [Ipomoea nil]
MEQCAHVACICCLLMVVVVFLSASAIAQTTNSSQVGRPGCPTRCGNLTVPYPFGIGIGSGCALDPGFEILCDTNNSNPPRPVLNSGWGGPPIPIHDISDTQIRVPSPRVFHRCNDSNGALIRRSPNLSWSLGLLKYNHYSRSPENKITILGCDQTLVITDETNATATTKCTSRCTGNASQIMPENGTCSGFGCCQLPLPKGVNKVYNITMITNAGSGSSFNTCGHAFLGETGGFRFLGATDLSNADIDQRVHDSVTVALDWAIGNLSCKRAHNASGYACKENSHCVDSDTGFGGYRCSCDYGYQGNPYLGCIEGIGNLSCKEAQNKSGYACQANSHCIDSDTGKGGYMCRCDDGYEGNPYLSPGCTDVDECKDPEKNTCELGCINIPGSFNCSCLDGYYSGDGQRCLLMNKKSDFPWLKFFLGIGLGVLAMVAIATSLCYVIKKKNRAKMRLKFFEQNGGFLLKQRITSSEGDNDGADVTKIYSAKELREATNNYAQDMILGRGGNGTVFKGILPNMLEVAIKRSKTVDDTQVEQFINEVVILSRINHRYIVKFLGCCLEAEVPLLVYEYISNGTLYHHIHRQGGASDWLSWENRLRIAIEAAGALAYLHSAASMPIIHRDVKSSNILIDENYTAKVSDFGASRLVPLDRTHLATLVQGTLGYLDPEYFQTSWLTEKSDVYSFGVVLAELLTERKPVSPNMSAEEDRNLSAYFVRSVNENRLFQILVPRLVIEGTLDQFERMAILVKRCLQLKGEDRPKMKEVASELESIRMSAKHSWEEPSCYVHEEDEPSDLYAVPISP